MLRKALAELRTGYVQVSLGAAKYGVGFGVSE